VTRVGSSNSAVRMTVVGIPEEAEGTGAGFLVAALVRSGVTLETIRRTPRTGEDHRSDLAFIVPARQATTALAVLRREQPCLGFEDFSHDGSVGRVSITGVGMRSSPEVLCTFLNALSAIGIDCDLVEISETGIGGITRSDRLGDAERAVRAAFGRLFADQAQPFAGFAEADPTAGILPTALQAMPVAAVPQAAPASTPAEWADPPVRELVSAGSAGGDGGRRVHP
jgi:aspartate kinase